MSLEDVEYVFGAKSNRGNYIYTYIKVYGRGQNC